MFKKEKPYTVSIKSRWGGRYGKNIISQCIFSRKLQFPIFSRFFFAC